MDIEDLLSAWMERHGLLTEKQQESFRSNFHAREIIKGLIRGRWDEQEIKHCLSKEKKLVEISHLLKRRETTKGEIRAAQIPNQLKPIATTKGEVRPVQRLNQTSPKRKRAYSKRTYRRRKSKARRFIGNFIGVFFFPIALLIAFTVQECSGPATETPSPTPTVVQIESTPTPTPTPTAIPIPSGPKCDGSGNLIGEWESYYEGKYFRKHPCFLFRVGAICMDEWESTATGQGACSHHGGVHYWFDENGNKETERYK